MALHPNFSSSPYEILNPDIRWFPADEDLRKEGYEKLLPPLVAKLRKEVSEWRQNNYEGASETSKQLLNWWFKKKHLIPKADGSIFNFQYYFAQREAVETVVFLYDVARARDKYDLLRYDSSGVVTPGRFPEEWPRYVIKMATGAGKTKVLSLILAWSFFHKTYEQDSQLARNFLLIAPNIIVLDRIKNDFEGLKVFFEDPILPEDGYGDKNWQSDFQLTLHLQDDLRTIRKTGNIFLTNIHRVYDSKTKDPSIDDDDLSNYFLGPKPVTKTTDSKINLSDIVRDIDELIVLNDEAHHIHNEKLAWFKSIQDIHNNLLLKDDKLSLQIDVTATPRHDNGGIFIQTVSDYPLVEAIAQDVVKHPVIPDEASRAKLKERQHHKFSERYADYLNLGVEEWRKTYKRLEPTGKKSILFVMTDDTQNCDEVAEYLSTHVPELKGKVLTIHTNKSGEISESVSGKSKEELDKVRKEANEIDSLDSPYRAVVSVLMLKEGWDVRNVTTIVGLRAYSSKSNILPEQTLGRGLRRMFRGEDVKEEVSVVGTDAFMEFVESIRGEGVTLEKRRMGKDADPIGPMVVEVDKENKKKNLEELDIEIPILTPRIYREYKNLSELKPEKFSHSKVEYKKFSAEQQREIIFKDIASGEVTHSTVLSGDLFGDSSAVIGYFAQAIMRNMRLVSGFDVLYGKVKEFVANNLFDKKVDLEDMNTLRNLSEIEATRTIIETFTKEINNLTVQDRGDAEVSKMMKVGDTRPIVVKGQEVLIPQKSVFNRIIGDSHFELVFASNLEKFEDVLSYAKNYFAVGFRLDYQNADGEISNFHPDFFVKTKPNELWIVETKGREDLDDPLKIGRLEQWCEDVNAQQAKLKINWLYVTQDEFEKQAFHNFSDVIKTFEKNA